MLQEPWGEVRTELAKAGWAGKNWVDLKPNLA